MPRDLLFSLMMSAGEPRQASDVDYAVGKNYVRFSNLIFLSKLNVWIDDIPSFPTEMFVEVWTDAEAVGAKPLWWGPVYKLDKSITGDQAARNPRNEFDFFQPIKSGQVDVQFRKDKPFPNGTVYKITTGKFSLELNGTPST